MLSKELVRALESFNRQVQDTAPRRWTDKRKQHPLEELLNKAAGNRSQLSTSQYRWLPSGSGYQPGGALGDTGTVQVSARLAICQPMTMRVVMSITVAR